MMAPRPDTPASATETIVTGGQQSVVPASVMPAPTVPAQPANGSVFDAPNMPGVRMMAPIPDNQPVVTSPTMVSTPIPVPRPSSTSAANRGLLDQTVTAAKNGDWSRAQRLAGETGSRPAQLFVEWLYLAGGGTDASFGQLSAFLSAHPNWPRREAMLTNAEKAMPADVDPRLVIEWYGDREPLTSMGMIRLGEAHLVAGSRERGIELIRKGWSEQAFSASEEAAILGAHGDILRDTDHRARLDQRLAADDIAAARRQIARVDGTSRQVAEARLKIKSGPDAVASIMASLPAELHANRGLLHDASRAYRRRDRDEQAYQVLL
jgi:soluble lytic murein transglycosylase